MLVIDHRLKGMWKFCAMTRCAAVQALTLHQCLLPRPSPYRWASPPSTPPPHRHPLSSRVRGLRRARPLHLYNCKLLKSKRHNMYLFAAPGSQYLICCFEMKVITFYPFEDKWNDSQR